MNDEDDGFQKIEQLLESVSRQEKVDLKEKHYCNSIVWIFEIDRTVSNLNHHVGSQRYKDRREK